MCVDNPHPPFPDTQRHPKSIMFVCVWTSCPPHTHTYRHNKNHMLLNYVTQYWQAFLVFKNVDMSFFKVKIPFCEITVRTLGQGCLSMQNLLIFWFHEWERIPYHSLFWETNTGIKPWNFSSLQVRTFHCLNNFLSSFTGRRMWFTPDSPPVHPDGATNARGLSNQLQRYTHVVTHSNSQSYPLIPWSR